MVLSIMTSKMRAGSPMNTIVDVVRMQRHSGVHRHIAPLVLLNLLYWAGVVPGNLGAVRVCNVRKTSRDTGPRLGTS